MHNQIGSTHVLVVDDDKRLRQLLSKYLQENNYFVSTVNNVESAYNIINFFAFDLIILDVMMEGKDGIEFSRELRDANLHIPILMLTALSDINNKINGFKSGVDDYLVKPFEPQELLLRIEAILKRSNSKSYKTQNDISNNIIKFGELTYDIDHQSLTNITSNRQISLTTTEKIILDLLTSNISKLINREDIVNFLQKHGERLISERSVDVQITRIRQKIEIDPKNPQYLKTVWGKGYILQNY